MTKILLTALALIGAPALGIAECRNDRQALSCADGSTYDADSRTCVPVSS